MISNEFDFRKALQDRLEKRYRRRTKNTKRHPHNMHVYTHKHKQNTASTNTTYPAAGHGAGKLKNSFSFLLYLIGFNFSETEHFYILFSAILSLSTGAHKATPKQTIYSIFFMWLFTQYITVNEYF